MLPEAPAAWNTLVMDADGFEEQFTLRAATARELMTRVGEMKNYLKQKGYRPVQRRSASAKDGAGQTNDAEPAQEQAPLCAIHNVPMERRSKNGKSWWSCSKKLDNGEWCPYRPKG